MNKKISPPLSRFGAIRYPDSGSVSLYGRLSGRFDGNQRYLEHIYKTRKDWMLEPFQNRGQEWVLEPVRNQKGELAWAGEYAGKWLDAASLASLNGRNERIRRHAAAFAADLMATQDADGYLGIEAPDRRGEMSGWDVWNVKYAMTGLLTHYEVNHDQACLYAAARGAEWLIQQFGGVTGEDHPFFHSPEGGGVSVSILDQIARLYRLTGDQRFNNFISSVVSHFPLVARMRDTCQAPLMHPYQFMGYLGGVVDWAAAENRADQLLWVEKVWEDLASRHLYPTGSLGYNELLRETAPNDTPVDNGIPERHHQETCTTVEWLLFNSQLYRATGCARYMQRLEQTIYNALLSAQSMDGMKWMYYTPLRYEKRWFAGPTSCCYFSGPRGIARLPEWVYALDESGLRVNLYESSEMGFAFNGVAVALRQYSLYPDNGKVMLQFDPDKPLSFKLCLRIPSLSGETRLLLNGRSVPLEQDMDGYYTIQRKWSKGDRVNLDFEIPITIRHFLNNQYGVLVRGPEVLAIDQCDNASLDLDEISLQEGTILRRINPSNERRRYLGEVSVSGRSKQVIFTPYADCGVEGSRFRTAFPVHS